VHPAGTLVLNELPLPDGQVVEVIVLPVQDDMEDLARASESGLDFWGNDIDDQVWNNAISST
jgi:hypothetical protein